MSDALLVALKIAAMFLVMAVGYFCRRRGLLDTQTTSVLSRICTDITLPPLIFLQMVEKVDLAALKVGWVIPLLAGAGICLGFVIGWITWRFFSSRTQAPVFIFSSGISNWIYLPLPIVSAIYKDDGLQTLFLCNVGIQVLFWSVGVAILQGGKIEAKSLKNLLVNPGLIATFAGIAFTIVRGLSGNGLTAPVTVQPGKSIVEIILDGMHLLAQATIPLSLLVTGAQIAAASLVQNRHTRRLTGIILNRLVVIPVICLLLLAGFAHLYPLLHPAQLMVIALVLLMPISVTSTVLTEKMNQDTSLAAQGVLYTPLFSVLSVPLIYLLAKTLLERV